MLVRGETTEERIAKIAEGFGQGVQNFQQGQDKQRAQGLQEEALRRQQALQELDIESKLSEQTGKSLVGSGIGKQYLTGGMAGIGELMNSAPVSKKAETAQLKLERENIKFEQNQKEALYKENQRSLPIEQRDDYKKVIARANTSAGNQEELYNKRLEGERNKKIQAVQIPDFDIADSSIIPTTKDAEEIKNLNQSNKSFQQIGQRVMDYTKKSDPRNPKYYISNDWRLLQQDLTEMKLQAKNLADLGVLNGPDLSLVNETLGSISPSTLAILGPEKAAERVASALKTANDKLINASASRGYKPKRAAQAPENNNQVSDLRAELEQRRAAKAQQQAGG